MRESCIPGAKKSAEKITEYFCSNALEIITDETASA